MNPANNNRPSLGKAVYVGLAFMPRPLLYRAGTAQVSSAKSVASIR